MQTTIGLSEEHVNLAGIPTEASILGLVERAMPGRVRNVYAASCGGGKIHGRAPVPQGHHRRRRRQRQAALLAFSAFPELKHVFLVDDDVDPFDMSDVLWAMTTRYQGNLDTVFLPGVRGHVPDPHAVAALRCRIPARGVGCKAIFDCTVPLTRKERSQRALYGSRPREIPHLSLKDASSTRAGRLSRNRSGAHPWITGHTNASRQKG